MKPSKAIIVLFCFLMTCGVTLAAQGLVTLTYSANNQITNASDTISINDQQVAYVRTVWTSGNPSGLLVNIQKSSSTFPVDFLSIETYYHGNFVVAGPASINLVNINGPPITALATFDIQPAQFPPDKAVTVGAYSGNVQVTMEMSTDLVNWTPAVNAMVYTNAPNARFFRIKMVTNATP